MTLAENESFIAKLFKIISIYRTHIKRGQALLCFKTL